MPDMSRIPLIYIAGSSHSGSTLLDLILGSHSLIESLGEAKKIPAVLRALKNARQIQPLCSCHSIIAECPFWRSVLRLDDPALHDTETGPFDSDGGIEIARRALEFRKRTVLVDSSKILGRLNFLARHKDIATTCLHLTRDPRAVAFSAIRKLEMRSVEAPFKNRAVHLMRQSLDWSSLNKKIRRRHRNNPQVSYRHLRYEDFVHDPTQALKTVLEMVKLDFEPMQMDFRKFTHHNIEGNRLRLQCHGEIQFDAAYLGKLSAFEWVLCSLLLLPTLRLFGYPVSRSSPISAESQKRFH